MYGQELEVRRGAMMSIKETLTRTASGRVRAKTVEVKRR